MVSRKGVSTDPKNNSAVKDWPTPAKVKEVRAFLGLCSYYRRFVMDFAKIARPLLDLTKKTERFNWTSDSEEAFQLLKTKLVTAPILALPWDTDKYIIDADALSWAL